MRILIIQEAGRHEENFQFREALCMSRALNRAGVDTLLWGRGQPDKQFTMDEYDAILFLENYDEDGWTPDISGVKKPKVFWSIDGHCAFDHHIKLCERNKFDLVLSSCKTVTDDFIKSGFESVWFPNAYPCDLINSRGTEKKHDLGYCGSLGNPERQKYLRNLDTIDLKRDIFVIGESMVQAINSYRIHFNRNLSNDINYRTFETMGCRTFLLTNETPGLSDLFDIGGELITYQGIDDCMDKIMFYLRNDTQRNAVANAGYQNVRDNHTYDARAHQLIKLLTERGMA